MLNMWRMNYLRPERSTYALVAEANAQDGNAGISDQAAVKAKVCLVIWSPWSGGKNDGIELRKNVFCELLPMVCISSVGGLTDVEPPGYHMYSSYRMMTGSHAGTSSENPSRSVGNNCRRLFVNMHNAQVIKTTHICSTSSGARYTWLLCLRKRPVAILGKHDPFSELMSTTTSRFTVRKQLKQQAAAGCNHPIQEAFIHW